MRGVRMTLSEQVAVLETQLREAKLLIERARKLIWDFAYTDENIDAGTVPADACDWARDEYNFTGVAE